MRYDATHKSQSRARILEAARQLFRRHGFDGASIEQVMSAAGLTRGAFYAHFPSKEALVVDVLGIEAGLVTALTQAALSPEPGRQAVNALAHYLDPVERSDVAANCPLVAHPVDAIRGDADRRAAYTDQIGALIENFDAVLGNEVESDRARLAAVLTIGGALLSAACTDPERADGIEAVCLEQLRKLLLPD